MAYSMILLTFPSLSNVTSKCISSSLSDMQGVDEADADELVFNKRFDRQSYLSESREGVASFINADDIIFNHFSLIGRTWSL